MPIKKCNYAEVWRLTLSSHFFEIASVICFNSLWNPIALVSVNSHRKSL